MMADNGENKQTWKRKTQVFKYGLYELVWSIENIFALDSNLLFYSGI